MTRRRTYRPLRAEALESRLNMAYLVDLATDEDDGNFATGDLSLREAIGLANADPAEDTISFAPGITTIPLTIGTLTLTDIAKTTINGGDVIVERIGVNTFGIFEVDLSATGELIGLTIRNGLANAGGGIVNRGLLTVTNSTLSGNSARVDGGGGIINNGRLTVTNSTLSGNSAPNQFRGGGGGIINNALLTVINSTLSGNSAGYNGGGIANLGRLTVKNSTLTGNRGDSGFILIGSGGGINTSIGGSTTLFNTIVAGNFISNGPFPNDLAHVDGTHVNVETASTNNLIGDAASAGGLTHNTNGNIVGVAVDTVLNPTLANNGGPTLTHALIANSLAINAGLDANISSGVTTDQRGAGFPRINGGTVDIGAVERAAAPPAFSLTPNLTTPSSEQSLTITVNLTGSPTPTGTVTLFVNDIPRTPAGLVGGQAQVILNGMPVGLNAIFARYNGDANYAAADSAVFNQQVYQPSDLNRTTAVDITDVLIAVFYFNTYANQLPIAVENLPPGPPFVDASGDGVFEIRDLLRVIFDYNQALANPEGEFAALPPLASSPALSSPHSAADAVLTDEVNWLWPELQPNKRKRS